MPLLAFLAGIMRSLCDEHWRRRRREGPLTQPGAAAATVVDAAFNADRERAYAAPVARDSGQHSGKRFIRAGRAHLRQALYMPTLVATRFNADMKAEYQAPIIAAKPPKVATTAIMRKLAILANALLRGQRNWTPKAA